LEVHRDVDLGLDRGKINGKLAVELVANRLERLERLNPLPLSAHALNRDKGLTKLDLAPERSLVADPEQARRLGRAHRIGEVAASKRVLRLGNNAAIALSKVDTHNEQHEDEDDDGKNRDLRRERAPTPATQVLVGREDGR